MIELALQDGELARHFVDKATELLDVPIFWRNRIREARCIDMNKSY